MTLREQLTYAAGLTTVISARDERIGPRYLDWIQDNRRRVDELSNGRADI